METENDDVINAPSTCNEALPLNDDDSDVAEEQCVDDVHSSKDSNDDVSDDTENADDVIKYEAAGSES